MSEHPRVIERSECARCGAEVRTGKRRHFCGSPYPLRACEQIVTVRYVESATAAPKNQEQTAPTHGKEKDA